MRAIGILGTAVSALALAACSAAVSAPTTPGQQAPSAEAPQVATSPFTGLPQASPSPVLIVKLDNTRNAQPHAGLKDADIVYLEEVEYGITRIASRRFDKLTSASSESFTPASSTAWFNTGIPASTSFATAWATLSSSSFAWFA